ncbi:MAG: TonB-dependent receptor [Gammaproteobacteria bacterium]|nr:TonB-dependent receptor [Gammaproteobacteria bacterium]
MDDVQSNMKWQGGMKAGIVLVSAAMLFLISLPVQGQETADDEEIEELIVTGSRVIRNDMESSGPLVQIESEELELQGTVRVEDMLRNLPQIWSKQNTGQSNGATGTATVELRNLGSVRTLVLLNGRRMPAGSPIGTPVDINQIPGNLIDRVEILTGGASATYGSDAVAGVINFIMKDWFEGIDFDLQQSAYSHNNSDGTMQKIVEDSGFALPSDNVTDGQMTQASLLMGGNIDDGRGNITLYATYRDIKAVRQADRDYSACALNNDADGCWGSSTIPQGRFTNFAGPPIGFDYMVDGTSFVPRAGTLFNYGPLNYFQRPDERYAFGAFGTYSVADTSEVYIELMFMDDRSVSQIAPSGAFFVTSSLSCSNPFLSDQQYSLLTQDRLSTEQQTELQERLDGMASDAQRNAYLDGAFCQNRVDDFINVYIGRRNIEGGPRRQDLRHTNFRVVAGIQGDINDIWRYDTYVQRSVVSMENTYQNDLGTTKIRRALDAVTDANGNTVCRSVIDGTDTNCVPWNIFDSDGVDQTMIDYLVLPLFARGTTEQEVFMAYVAGNLLEYDWVLPSSDRGVDVVIGFETRSEGMTFDPDEGYRNGEGAGQGGATNPVAGEYDVTEFFLESVIPITEGRDLIEELDLEAGYRFSDYSTGHTTHTWGLRLSWSPNMDLRFRGSIQRAVRAANIRELFTPQGFNLFDMDEDPCGGPVTDGQTTAGRTLAECQRSGVTPAQFGNIQHSPAGQYNFLQGGNPDVSPEESDTLTAGVVWTPPNLNNLSLAVDIYNVRIEQGISILTPEYILNECLDGDDSQCRLVKRSSARGDLWIGSEVDSSGHIVALNDNLAVEEVTGLDAIIDYSFTIDRVGTFDIHNVFGLLTQWDTQELAAADVVDCLGVWGGVCGYPIPNLRNNLRVTVDTVYEPLVVSAMWRFTGEMDHEADGPVTLDKVHYIDLAGIYTINEDTSVRAGMNNVFDVDPPIAGNGAGPSISGNGNVFPGSYDALGRYWYIALKVDM